MGELVTRVKISRSTRYFLLSAFTVWLIAKSVNFFLPETVALAWHLRHGLTAYSCGVEVHVPMRYSALVESHSLALFNLPGYARARFFHAPHSNILLYEMPDSPKGAAEGELARMAAALEERGYKLMGKRPVAFAGRPLVCWELYTEHFADLGAEYEIHCAAQDTKITATFNGSPSMLSDFYSVLESAKPSNR